MIMDHAEAIAKVLVETVCPGTRMEYRTDQSRSVHDFDLHHANGAISAVEVTSSVDFDIEDTNTAIRNPKKGGSAIKANLCKNDWYIHPITNANINRIRKDVDRHLADIEHAGVSKFFSPMDSSRFDAVKRIYDLGIVFGTVFKWSEPGYIRMAPPDSGGAVDVNDLLMAVRTEAFKHDNRRKLHAAGTDERHLLVYIHPRNFLAWCALMDLRPPMQLPDIPNEVTDIWAFSEGRNRNSYKIWRGGTRMAWQSLAEIVITGPVD